MTKYLLNSGGISNSADKGKKFFNAIIEGLGNKPHILFCFFAKPREEWEANYEEYKAGFIKQLPKDKNPFFELAFPDKFAKQIQKADAIYIHGGDDYLLQYWLRQFPLPKLWAGKVVATNSASSNALSTRFWTCDWRQCIDGIGILPIKFLAHYESDYGKDDPRGQINWLSAKKELENYGDKSLPVYALNEGEFIFFEQEEI